MKKVILVSAAVLVSAVSFAQTTANKDEQNTQNASVTINEILEFRLTASPVAFTYAANEDLTLAKTASDAARVEVRANVPWELYFESQTTNFTNGNTNNASVLAPNVLSVKAKNTFGTTAGYQSLAYFDGVGTGNSDGKKLTEGGRGNGINGAVPNNDFKLDYQVQLDNSAYTLEPDTYSITVIYTISPKN